MTHSKTTGGRKNFIKDNPLKTGGKGKTYIVRREEKDKKGRFSLFEIETKPGVDISYPEIKKARRVQTRHESNHGRTAITSSKIIKANNDKRNKKK